MEIEVLHLYQGLPSPLEQNSRLITSINKTEVDLLSVFLDRLAGDEVQNKIHHGGINRVIHHYPIEHYQFFKDQYPATNFKAGLMGENISTLGMKEENVCIGDIFKVGDVQLLVTEPRKPCGMINQQFQIKNLARFVQTESKTGWFYRILKEGKIHRGDKIILMDRPFPHLNVDRCVQGLLVNLNTETLELIVANPVISENWKRPALEYLKTGIKIDDKLRLGE